MSSLSLGQESPSGGCYHLHSPVTAIPALNSTSLLSQTTIPSRNSTWC